MNFKNLIKKDRKDRLEEIQDAVEMDSFVGKLETY